MKRIICLMVAVSALSFWAGSASERYKRNAWKRQAAHSGEKLIACREITNKLEARTLIPFNAVDGTKNFAADRVEAFASPIVWSWMNQCSARYYELAVDDFFALDCPNGNLYIAPVLQPDGETRTEASCEGWPQ